MPYKDKEEDREYHKRYHQIWYQKNKEQSKIGKSLRLKEIKEWFSNYKSELSCSRCGEKHPAIIDFHHINNEEKEAGICSMVSDGFSKESILAEVEKCEVVCSNCHRKIHYDERKK